MSYRIIRITDYYPEFLEMIYKTNIKDDTLSYTQEYNEIISHSIETVSSYGENLRKIGVDAIDVISNANILQKKWLKEHTSKQGLSNDDIVLEQVKYYRPDVVWIDTTQFLNKDWILNLRKEVKSIKLVVGHSCAPYNTTIEAAFHKLDIVFTCTPCIANELKEKGVKNVELIYHSFDSSVLNRIETDNTTPKTNAIFTGSLISGHGFHSERIAYLEEIINSEIDLTLFGNLEDKNKIFKKRAFSQLIRLMSSLKLDYLIDNNAFLNKHKLHAEVDINYYSEKLLKSVSPPVFGLDMYKVLANSNLCFNNHGSVAKSCAGNIRLFEATGVGTCLVTDMKSNMQDLFNLETEVVTYNSPEECIDKMKWLIANPVEMKKIAVAGQKRTLKKHTIESRVEILNEILLNALKEV